MEENTFHVFEILLDELPSLHDVPMAREQKLNLDLSIGYLLEPSVRARVVGVGVRVYD